MKLDKDMINMIRKCESDQKTRDALFWLMVEQYTDAVMAAFLHMFQKYTSPFIPGVEISADNYNVVMKAARTNKIEAIKALRNFTRCGLREAKDTVEYWMEQEATRLVPSVCHER